MSRKKHEVDRRITDTIRYIIGFSAFAFVMYYDEKSEYQIGPGKLSDMLLVIGLCVVGLFALVPVSFVGFPEAILRKLTKGTRPSGGPYSGEAQDYFEAHPYETTYTDSHGSSWDNTFFDD